MTYWTAQNIPDQTGRVALVTGANSGLGYETTRALVHKGAHVVMACRTLEKGYVARDALLQEMPEASLDVQSLDLASLDSIYTFANTFMSAYQRLDLLFNNAGVMAPPRRETADGFELQLGTNHLGHFALTGRLIDLIVHTDGSRVVTTSSGAHRIGRMNFADLQRVQSYDRWGAYGQSKLANLLFAFELQRKLAKADTHTISVAAHPGYADTSLQSTGPGMDGTSVSYLFMRFANAFLAQSAAMGALPQLYAGTAPDVIGGDFYGPNILGWRGYPQKEAAAATAYDPEAAAQLWQVSEELTGVRYQALELQSV